MRCTLIEPVRSKDDIETLINKECEILENAGCFIKDIKYSEAMTDERLRRSALILWEEGE